MNPTLPPVNVIFLNDSQLKSKDEIIEDYIDLKRSCETDADYRAMFSLIFEEVTMRTGKMILHKQIQKDVQILEELQK